MSPARPYVFQILSSTDLSPGNSEDPYRFFQEGETPPLRSPSAVPRLSLEAWDLDNNRQLNAHDRYFYVGADHRRLGLSSEFGLRLLNYYLDPHVLERRGLGIAVRSGSLTSSIPVQGDERLRLSEIPALSPVEREEIEGFPFPFWELDGHLDLNI